MNLVKKSTLPILWFIVFIDMLGLTIVIPLLAPLFLETSRALFPVSTTIATRTALLGLLLAIYPLMQFFSAPLLGALSDRHGRKKILLVSLIGTATGYGLFAVGIIQNSLSLLFISRILDGITGGNISIAMASIADISDEKNKSKNFGLIGMAFGFGFILGPFIGGKLSDSNLVSWFNFATPLWFAMSLAIINIILLVKLFNETLTTRINRPLSLTTGIKNISKAFAMNNIRVLFFFLFLVTFGFSFYTQFSSVFLLEKFNYTQVQIGNFFGYVGLWIAITQGLIIRAVSKRFRGVTLLISMSLLLSISLFALSLQTNSIWLFLISPFIALSYGIIQPTTSALISNAAARDSQGEILGINQSLQSLAQAVPPLIAGFIVSVHPSIPVVIASLTVLCAWLLIIFNRNNLSKPVSKFHEI